MTDGEFIANIRDHSYGKILQTLKNIGCRDHKPVHLACLVELERRLEVSERGRPTGRWIDSGGDYWICSHCGTYSYMDEDFRPDDKRAFKMNFCHYCGADMRRTGDGEEV